MKIERNIRGLSCNPILKFQTYRQRKEDSEANFLIDLGSGRVRELNIHFVFS